MLTTTSRLQDFPQLETMIYLNTAAEGIPPVAVGEALLQYFRDHQQGMDGRVAHAAQREAVLELTSQLYCLTQAEIGLCSFSSEAYNLEAMALKLQPCD